MEKYFVGRGPSRTVASDGGSTSYYEIPPDAEELDDLIMHKQMPWHIANIFKACYRYGEKDGSSELYDLRKMIWMAERRIKYLEQNKDNR